MTDFSRDLFLSAIALFSSIRSKKLMDRALSFPFMGKVDRRPPGPALAGPRTGFGDETEGESGQRQLYLTRNLTNPTNNW